MSRAADVTTLVLAVLLVLALPALFVALPDEPEPRRDFMARFEETQRDIPLASQFVANGSSEITFDVPQGNLTRIDIVLELGDDQAASEPDQFVLQLRGPDGQLVGVAVESATQRGSLTNDMPPTYSAPRHGLVLTVRVHERPSSQILPAASADETAAQAAARLAATTTTAGAGTWTLVVQLASAGCPDPVLDPPRSAACRAETPDGIDPGNPLDIVAARTTHYAATVAER